MTLIQDPRSDIRNQSRAGTTRVKMSHPSFGPWMPLRVTTPSLAHVRVDAHDDDRDPGHSRGHTCAGCGRCTLSPRSAPISCGRPAGQGCGAARGS